VCGLDGLSIHRKIRLIQIYITSAIGSALWQERLLVQPF